MKARSRNTPPSSETITDGTARIGLVIGNARGFEAYGADNKIIATFPSKEAARKAVYQHRQSNAQGGAA